MDVSFEGRLENALCPPVDYLCSASMLLWPVDFFKIDMSHVVQISKSPHNFMYSALKG